jgi:hypothetical protein
MHPDRSWQVSKPEPQELNFEISFTLIALCYSSTASRTMDVAGHYRYRGYRVLPDGPPCIRKKLRTTAPMRAFRAARKSW